MTDKTLKVAYRRTRGGGSRRVLTDVRRDWQLYLLALPGLIILFTYRYIPMGGLVIAFKDYGLRRGIWDSPWVGCSPPASLSAP